jgi:hypothetical protein
MIELELDSITRPVCGLHCGHAQMIAQQHQAIAYRLISM